MIFIKKRLGFLITAMCGFFLLVTHHVSAQSYTQAPPRGVDIPSGGIACPFEPSPESIVVDLGNKVLIKNSFKYDVQIPAGDYAVELFAWDSYEWRGLPKSRLIYGGNQKEETYHVEFYANGAEITRSNETVDITDYADPGYWFGSVNDSLNIAQAIDEIVVTYGQNSVIPGCMRLVDVSPFCGNGIVDDGEECDGGSFCTTSCLKKPVYNNHCGDGRLSTQYNPETGQPAEECDDGNNIDYDGCSATCLVESVQPCIDLDNDNQCDLVQCGIAHQKSYPFEAPADTDLCPAGILAVKKFQHSDQNWQWECHNGSDVVQCEASKNCRPDEYLCDNRCNTLTIDGNLYENFPRDDGVIYSTQVLNGNESCVQSCVEVGTGRIIPLNEAIGYEITHVEGEHGIAIECSIKPQDCADDEVCECEGDDCDKITVNKNIQCVCSARRCTSNGQCVASPVFGQSSGSAPACTNECQTNADCSGSGYSEVGA